MEQIKTQNSIRLRPYKIVKKLKDDGYGDDILNSVRSALDFVILVPESGSEESMLLTLDDACFEASEHCVPVFDQIIRLNSHHLQEYVVKGIHDGQIYINEDITALQMLRRAWELLIEDACLAEIDTLAFNIMAEYINSIGIPDTARKDAVRSLHTELKIIAEERVTAFTAYRDLIQCADKALESFGLKRRKVDELKEKLQAESGLFLLQCTSTLSMTDAMKIREFKNTTDHRMELKTQLCKLIVEPAVTEYVQKLIEDKFIILDKDINSTQYKMPPAILSMIESAFKKKVFEMAGCPPIEG